MEIFQNFKGLIFDCDGTLIDSMPVHYMAWRETMKRHGIPFPESRFYELGGVPANKIVALLANEEGITADPDAISHEKEDLFLEIAGNVLPFPEIVAIAKYYHGKVPLAVATGGYRKVIRKTLGAAGLWELFDTFVCAEDVQFHKPAPDVYLEAAHRLKVPPSDCAAFEDTDIGLQAISSAGMVGFDVRKRPLTPIPPV